MSDQALITTGTPLTLEQRLEGMKIERELMDQFVRSQLKDGVDYAPAFNGSKPTLLKPGSEKVCLLLDLMPVFEVDQETHNVLSPEVKADTICYRCKLVNRKTGEMVADGRGACSIRKKNGDVNNTIKIAEKRAQLDATLRVAALSDRFTQDMEKGDVVEPPKATKPVQQAPKKPDVPAAAKPVVKPIPPVRGRPTITKVMEAFTEAKTLVDLDTLYKRAFSYRWDLAEAKKMNECYIAVFTRLTNYTVAGLSYFKSR